MFLSIFATLGVSRVAYGQDENIWYKMQKAQRLARKNNKKIIIYAGANWCIYCQKMDEEVFPKKAVIDSLDTYFYGVKVDVDSQAPIIFNGKTVSQNHFAREHHVRSTPTFIFLNSDGTVIGNQPGYMPAKTFSRLLGYIGSEAYKKMEFGTYLTNRSKK